MPIIAKSNFRNYVLRLNPLLTKYRCAYNKETNLRKPAHTIRVFYLITSASRGTSVIEGFYYTHIRRPITPSQWANHLREKGVAAFATRYLSNINEHYGEDWALEKLLCFVVQNRQYSRNVQKRGRLQQNKTVRSKAKSRNSPNA